jgi:type IV pilus assembly protein PilM
MFYIGITLEKEAFRVAILKKEKNAIAIVSLQTFPFGPDNVKLFYNLPPFHTGKRVQIISGLCSSEIIIRKLHLPLKDKRKILSALPFQLETLIPFPTENALICPLLNRVSKQMTSVTVIAAAREQLSHHLDALKELDIEPDNVSCDPAALVRFAKWQFPKEQRVLSFHAREQKISCALSEGGELMLCQTLPIGKKEEISLALDKLLIFLKQKGAVDEQTPWLLTGEADLKETIRPIFLGPELKLDEPALSSYAVALGLALDGLKSDESTVQFCQKEFTPEHTHQFRKQKLLSYLGFCVAATLAMAIGGSLMLGKKQRAITERLQSYLSPSLAKGSLSTQEEVQEKLYEWEKSISRQKTPFPFLPTVPKVSDVLAWLSTHPAFSTEEGAKKEGMEIKSMRYSLIKYPKIGDASSPYLAQMEVEFTSTAPRAARDFHEALLKGDQIVNAKKEVKWQTQNQTYHASFELNKGLAP